MKLINIVPVNNLGLTNNQPLGMFLVHLAFKFPHYKQSIKKFAGYKILDNSLIELGSAVCIEDVISIGRECGVDEIILPDVFKDMSATLTRTATSLATVQGRCDISGWKPKIMAVCQGSTWQEFRDCFNELNKWDGIDVIGIPKHAADLHPSGRAFFEFMWDGYCVAVPKEIHLLGLKYSFSELNDFKNPERIRSVDSCLAAYFACQGVHEFNPYAIRPNGHTIPLDDMNLVMNYERYLAYINHFTNKEADFSDICFSKCSVRNLS